MDRFISRFSLFILLSLALFITSVSSSYASILNNRETIVFLGDSITAQGMHPRGYVTLVNQALKRAHPGKHIRVIGAGVSGNTVIDLQKRLHRDVLSRKPSVVVIYTGVNDVWSWNGRYGRVVPKHQFSQGLIKMVKQVKSSGARVILVTPAVMGERIDGRNRFDRSLNEYAAITRMVAKNTGSRVIDLRHAFMKYLYKHNKRNVHQGVLTKDSVHFNERGNRLLSQLMLRTLGVSQ